MFGLNELLGLADEPCGYKYLVITTVVYVSRLI